MTSHNDLRDAANRAELAKRIGRAVNRDGVEEPLEGLYLTCATQPTDRIYGVTKPSLCVIAQGAKELILGDRRYRYDAHHYLLATVELPATGCVIEATPAEPYLALRLDLDPALVGSVMVEAGIPMPRPTVDSKAIVVSPLETDLLDAVVRLLRLLDRPADSRVLLPLVKREIAYLLLIGAQGSRLGHLPAFGGHADRIAQAIDRLRSEFDRPLRIEDLARELGMSQSAFHQHFKAVTDMSPLQFQKQLRLQEARRLLLGEQMDAAGAGYRVGYEDASHFSRDYKRQFGFSPMRDVERLRAMIAAD